MILFKIFEIILTMSFLGTITALVILLVKKIFKQKISPFWHYLIWLILLLRLIVPYAPESNMSIFNLFTNKQQQITEVHSPLIQVNTSFNEHTSNKNKINTIQQGEPEKNPFPEPINPEMLFLENNLSRNYLPFMSDNSPPRNSTHIFHIASIIWLLGVCTAGIYIIWVHLSYNLKIKKLPIYNNKKVNLILNSCRRRMKVHRKIPLILDPMINTPSLLGVINPKIIISPDCINLLTVDELKFVFMHELAHYKQKDIIIRWILLLLQFLHWFNPVLWFTINKIRQDSETACDARVLSYIDPDDYKRYGKTMLKMLDIFSETTCHHGIAGILNKKKIVIERVQNIVNFKKHYLIWSFVGIIIFSGLAIFLLTNAKGQPEEVIKIKYTAEEFAPELELGVLDKTRLLSDKKLLTYDDTKDQFIIIDDQGIKENIDFKGLTENSSIELFSIDSNDHIYAFIEDKNPLIYVYNRKGEKIKEIILELKNINLGENNQVYRWDMEIDSKGNIYILIPGINIQIFDPTGKYIKNLSASNHSLIEIDGEDNLYTINWKDKVVITKLNPLSSKIIWQYEDNKNLPHIEKAHYLEANTSLYLMTSESIYRFNLEDHSLNKTVFLDAVLSDKFQDEFMLRDFTVNKEGIIYLSGYNQKNYQGYIIKVISKKIQVNDDIKTITISVQSLSPTLEYAINKFENQHPNIVINIENYNAFSWFTSNMTYEETLQASEETAQKGYDFLQKINARMLTDKGPDILQLNNIPYRKYADKNLLLDLNQLMADDTSFNKTKYYTNIFEALEYKDKLFIMPLSFSCPAFLTNTGFLKERSIEVDDNKWTWNDFIDIANKVTIDLDGDEKIDIYGLPTITAERLFLRISSSMDKSFIDYENKKAYFTSEEFIDLLTICRNISEEKIMNPDITEANISQGGFVFHPYKISDSSVFYSNMLINADTVSFYRLPGSNNSNYNFDTGDVYGINSRTKHKKESWEFIKFLLSEEIQSYNKLYDIAINKKAREDKIQDELAETKDMINRYGFSYGYQVSSKDKILKQIKTNLKTLNDRIAKLNYSKINDIQVNRIITDEIHRFFNGEKTAEETAQTIQRKVEMYFNE